MTKASAQQGLMLYLWNRY